LAQRILTLEENAKKMRKKMKDDERTIASLNSELAAAKQTVQARSFSPLSLSLSACVCVCVRSYLAQV
jgi:hypothetical protein